MDDFNKKVKEKIKIYSGDKYLDGYIKSEFSTEDGEAVIYLNVNNKNELFDTMTVNNQLDLNNSIYEYIEKKTSMLGNQVPIRLKIMGCNLSSHEQGIVRHVLKEHFAIELYNQQLEYIKYRNKIIFLIVLGLISILLYGLASIVTDSPFILTILSFLFSFSIWEAMDSVIYAFSDIKYNREAITQNLLINVEFVESNKDKSE